jgi:hypothetical protein
MENFSAAIKMISSSGCEITKYPSPEGSSYFFCTTEEQIDTLIKNKYSQNWSTPDVFKHITEIIKKPIDEILIKFIPLITCWHDVYRVSTFYGREISYGSHVDMIKIAILLNSTKLVEKIIESSAKANYNDLMFACDIAHDDIIMLLIKCCPSQKNIKENGKTALDRYIMNGQNKQVVQILATKENIFCNDTNARIIAQFGGLFLADLIRDLYADVKSQQYEIGDLVDIDGNLICKDPAESAVAIFTRGSELQRDEVHKVFVEPCRLMVTDISGKKIAKEFINGIHIEIPISQKNDNKLRYHMLTIYDKNMLVRFDKLR